MSFKNFNEKASYHRSIAQQMAASMVPLTDKITSLLGYGRNTQTFHATTLDHLEGLKKLGKSKKQLSTFTKGLGSLIGSISIKPEVIAKLEGRSVIDFSGDAFTHPDKQGRRWAPTRGHKKSEFFQDALQRKVIAKMLEYDKTGLDFNFPSLFHETSNYIGVFESLTNKEKSEVIKLYIDNATHLLGNTMYSEILNDIMETRSQSNKSTFDEVILNKFKVLGVYSIEANRYQYDHSTAQSDIEKLGYDYLGHIPKEDFSKVTPETY